MTRRRKAWFLSTLQLILLICFVFPATRSAMRDNDQASIITGALQMNAGQVSPFHDTLYNFDKQFGSFFLLEAVYKIFPHLDPTLLSNLLLVVLYSVGSLLALHVAEKHGFSRTLGAILVLTPSMIFYAPFLGTSQLSLAFLLLGYPLLRTRVGWRFYAGLLFLALATAMRVDALFCVPAIYIAISARRTLRQVLVDPKMWSLIAAAAVPFFAGRYIVPRASSDQADHFFIPSYYVALLVFAIGLPWLISAASFAWFGVNSGRRRLKWLAFYLTMAASIWWGLAYYAIQMYSARYFFPAFFCSFILFSSRRGRCWFRSWQQSTKPVVHWAIYALVALSVLPWFVGIHMRSAKKAFPSLSQMTTMPTSDGLLPMGAYAAFEARMVRQHDLVDHNQETLESARTVHFVPCTNGRVAIYSTPMDNYLEEAAEEQHIVAERFPPTAVPAGCAKVYVDLRSIMRKDIRLQPFLAHALAWESAPESTRPVLSLDGSSAPNAVTEWVRAAVIANRGTDASYHSLRPQNPHLEAALGSELTAVAFTDTPSCLPADSTPLPIPGSSLNWAVISASSIPRRVSLCGRETGGLFEAEVPQFMQKSHQ